MVIVDGLQSMDCQLNDTRSVRRVALSVELSVRRNVLGSMKTVAQRISFSANSSGASRRKLF